MIKIKGRHYYQDMREVMDRTRDHVFMPPMVIEVKLPKKNNRRKKNGPVHPISRIAREVFAMVCKGSSCIICGENDARCLDYHHRDPKAKMFNICRAQCYSVFSVIEELGKCDVLCANCHRKLHTGVISTPTA